MQGIFRKENTDKALKYGIYRHLPTYEKIIRNLVSFSSKKLYNKNKNSTEVISVLLCVVWDVLCEVAQSCMSGHQPPADKDTII